MHFNDNKKLDNISVKIEGTSSAVTVKAMKNENLGKTNKRKTPKLAKTEQSTSRAAIQKKTSTGKAPTNTSRLKQELAGCKQTLPTKKRRRLAGTAKGLHSKRSKKKAKPREKIRPVPIRRTRSAALSHAVSTDKKDMPALEIMCKRDAQEGSSLADRVKIRRARSTRSL